MLRLPFLPERTGLLASVVALCLISSACVHQEAAGVKVQPLKADIDFGVKLPEPTGTITPAAPIGPREQAGEVALLPDIKAGSGFKVIPLRAKPICPDAAANAFPEKPSQLEVEGMPVPGVYRWKKGGSFTVTGVTGTFPITGLEQRYLRRVTDVSSIVNPADGTTNHVFTFETVQPIGGDTVLVTDYKVQTNAPGQREVNPQTGQRVRSGDPERGLVIKKFELLNTRTGQADYTFDTGTNTGALLFPLPVSPGQATPVTVPPQSAGPATVPAQKVDSPPDFTSTAVSQRTNDTLTISGTVRERVQLDACGDVIEGWKMTGTRTLTTTDQSTGTRSSQSSPYTIVVATQYGAMPIFETFDFTNSAGSSHQEYTLGQITPSPLPDEVK